jgi:hypothetical protein
MRALISFLARAVPPLLLAAGVAGSPAVAAQPTQAQQSAIRSACSTDYRSYCASVPAGGSAALECLQKNLASLSPSCKSAVAAVGGTAPPAAAQPTQVQQDTSGGSAAATAQTAPAQAAPAQTGPAPVQPTQPTEAQLTTLRAACPRDYGTYCGNVPAGGAASLQCLEKNVASLSPQCKSAVEAIAPPKPAEPTPEQLTALRSACPRDYGTYCGDVPAGGAASFQCLQKNVASLSPSCKSAVEAVGGGPATTAAATTKPPPAAPAQPTQAQQSAIRSACQTDYRSHCASVPAGGSAALQCLQKNLGTLSASCKKAVAAVGGAATTAGATGGTAAVATVAAAPPAPKPVVLTPRQEMGLMRDACGYDYRAFCSGVRIMGGAALNCLMANAGSLSGGCKSALKQLQQRP